MDHLLIDLLARERITDMRKEAQESRMERTKAPHASSEPRLSITGLRKVVARIALAG